MNQKLIEIMEQKKYKIAWLKRDNIKISGEHKEVWTKIHEAKKKVESMNENTENILYYTIEINTRRKKKKINSPINDII